MVAYDLLGAGLAILICSIIIAAAWISTRVNDPPVVSTTIFLFQNDAHSNANPINENLNNTVTGTNNSTGISASETSTSTGNSNAENRNENIMQSDTTGSTTSNLLDPSNSDSETHKNKEIPSTGTSNKDSDTNRNEAAPSTSNTNDEKTDTNEIMSTGNSSTENISTNESDVNITKNILANETDSSGTSGQIRIKLRFLDETQRQVIGKLTDLIGNFKRAHFEMELSTNCAVRLIFNGQILSRDSETLGQYGLFDNCVVHCYVGEPASEPDTAEASRRNQLRNRSTADDVDFSEILSPLLLLVMGFLWYLRYEYSHLFNNTATFILILLSALLMISQYALTITVNISLALSNNTTVRAQNTSSESSRSENDSTTESDSLAPVLTVADNVIPSQEGAPSTGDQISQSVASEPSNIDNEQILSPNCNLEENLVQRRNVSPANCSLSETAVHGL